MKAPTVLDAVVIGIPILFGFLGARVGFRRSLVSWPIRWLMGLIGAQAMLALVTIYLISNRDIAVQIQAVDPMIRQVVSVLLFLIFLVVLLGMTRSVRRRVIDRIGDSFIGPIERAFGGLFGIAGGFLLVAWLVVIPYMFYETIRSEQDRDPAWVRESFSLPHIKSAGEWMRDTLLSYVSAATDRPRRAL
jgi:membrane protein required for colicin V production